MAFTVSQVVTNSVFGDLRVKIVNVTPDATTGSVNLGMGALHAVIPSIKSMASYINSGATRNIAVVAVNAGPLGTAIVGEVALTGCIANDVYTLLCFSKS
jgi:hypothetical protein